MSLPILIFAVVIGVSLIVCAVHLSGSSLDFSVTERVAVERYREDFPEAHPKKTLVSVNRKAAVLLFDNGVGLVAVIGDKFLTRWIEPGEAQVRRSGNVLNIALNDVTWHGCSVQLPTESDAQLCETALANFEKREKSA